MNRKHNKYEKTIIIADDDSINIELISIILRNINANIVSFENGLKVIDYIADNHADIIILDIQMPILNGFETSQKLHEMGFDGAILALTALNTTNEMEKYEDYKFDEVIEKPIRRIEFLKIINQYLENN
ncbi:MAG: response regulator [Bacteroidales bacterium]|nr:response regulator [Bacteroidales bacterium]